MKRFQTCNITAMNNSHIQIIIYPENANNTRII